MKVLFVHNYLATFTQIDLDILSSAHEVRVLAMDRTSAGRLLRDNADVVTAVRWADLIFAWFGGYHALLPFLLGRALGRKCVVVASGYDVAAMPEINYGNMRPGWRRLAGQRVFALADRVLAVSEFTRREAMRNAGVPAAKIEVIPHGLNTEQFYPRSARLRAAQVLTVGGTTTATLRTKGAPDFMALAALFPEIPFLIVGPREAEGMATLRQMNAPNVQFLGPLYREDLIQVMQQSTVYAQLSAYESFGMALAEAMLCGCAPVVTDRGALPEVVGDAGWVAPYGDLAAYACAIKQALAAPASAGENARQRIVNEFSLERRRQCLLQSLEKVQADVSTVR